VALAAASDRSNQLSSNSGDRGGFELKDSQSLAALFNVAVACQRAGDHATAALHYQTILDGAAQVAPAFAMTDSSQCSQNSYFCARFLKG
jgi:hypothetical protein